MKERFKDIRIKLGYTQAQFAQILNTNQQSVTDIESGRKKPNEDIMEKLHNELSINLNWLICGSGKMKEDFFNMVEEPQSIYKIETNEALKETIKAQKQTIELLTAEIERLKK